MSRPTSARGHGTTTLVDVSDPAWKGLEVAEQTSLDVICLGDLRQIYFPPVVVCCFYRIRCMSISAAAVVNNSAGVDLAPLNIIIKERLEPAVVVHVFFPSRLPSEAAFKHLSPLLAQTVGTAALHTQG
jgi:hypothetical protein